MGVPSASRNEVEKNLVEILLDATRARRANILAIPIQQRFWNQLEGGKCWLKTPDSDSANKNSLDLRKIRHVDHRGYLG